MRKVWISVAEVAAFMAVLAVGVWLRAPHLNAPMPLPQEAPALLGAAACGEGLGRAHWPAGVAEAPSPFLAAAGVCARFFHGGAEERPQARCYRVFGLALSALFLAGIPALGLRRRGGVFETADGPLWAMAFAALSPALIWSGRLFDPFSGQALAFLALLVAARAYAQWPGAASAAAFGAIVAVGLGIDVDVAWALAALAPAVAVGVGWTRLCLYWRTGHVAVAVAAGVAVWAVSANLGLWGGWPSAPALPAGSEAWVRAPAWRLVWLCAGGLAFLAWLGLTVWGGWRPGRRWARLMAAAFPLCLAGSLFFREGGALAVPLACLTPVMGGMALSAIPRPWVRGVVGVGACAFLACWQGWTLARAWEGAPSRAEQKAAAATLAGARDAPARLGTRVRAVTDGAGECAALLWPLRGVAPRVAMGAEGFHDDADILIVPEGRLGGLTPDVGRRVRPGVACVWRGRAFRVFARRPGNAEEAL